ncbi:MAG: glycosyltransferase family 39 protein [Anaerolineae bacterium]|nr:glycosyltransferase family 39 protein [Anaerolineae bacterium]
MLKKIFTTKNGYIAAILLVFLAALAVRLFDLDNPPLDFHAPRQIHSAIIARGFYAFMPNHMSGFEHDKAWSFSSELWIEPPIFEYLTAMTYVAAGDAYLWIPRVYSIVFWCLGALALLLLMRKLTGKCGALAAIIYFLFLPYAILASRSFQPDPLMVALIAFSIWALLRWLESHSWKDALLTGLFTGAAILVKQVAVFFLGTAIAAVLINDWGLIKSIKSLKVWLIAGLALLPVIIYNVYGLFISGFLQTQYALRFFPELFIDPVFYYRWASKIDLTTGWLAFLAALSGILFLVDRNKRWLLAALFGGYFVYGLAFAYHISTHDYYQEPLILVTAIGIGVLCENLWQALNKDKRRFGIVFLSLVVIGGSLFSLWSVRTEMKRSDYRAQPDLWRRLGREFDYGNKPVVGLFNDYGVGLMYWGYTMPAVWESTGDIKMRELAGQQQVQDDIYYKLEGKYYFIVTDFAELDNQPELKNVLETYRVYERGNGYVIYDLMHPVANDPKGATAP